MEDCEWDDLPPLISSPRPTFDDLPEAGTECSMSFDLQHFSKHGIDDDDAMPSLTEEDETPPGTLPRHHEPCTDAYNILDQLEPLLLPDALSTQQPIADRCQDCLPFVPPPGLDANETTPPLLLPDLLTEDQLSEVIDSRDRLWEVIAKEFDICDAKIRGRSPTWRVEYNPAVDRFITACLDLDTPNPLETITLAFTFVHEGRASSN
jgi:hypothetical protein